MERNLKMVLFVCLALAAREASAGVEGLKCRVAKLDAASKYAGCLAKARSRFAVTADAARLQSDLQVCGDATRKKWGKIEAKAIAAQSACPTEGDFRVMSLLTSTALAQLFSNLPRFFDIGETIFDLKTGLTWERKVGLDGNADFANLHDADNTYNAYGGCSVTAAQGWDSVSLKTCQPSAAAQSACSAGAVGDTSGCQACAPSDGSCIMFQGSNPTMWQWLSDINASSFAGYNDWRVPTLNELYELTDHLTQNSATYAVFAGANCGASCLDLSDSSCSCTSTYSSATCDIPYCYPITTTSCSCDPTGYWSAESSGILFLEGIISPGGVALAPGEAVTGLGHLRAVRGG